MLTRLPKPYRIFFCQHCQDVTFVDTDRHGDYCAECQYPVNWPIADKSIDLE